MPATRIKSRSNELFFGCCSAERKGTTLVKEISCAERLGVHVALENEMRLRLGGSVGLWARSNYSPTQATTAVQVSAKTSARMKNRPTCFRLFLSNIAVGLVGRRIGAYKRTTVVKSDIRTFDRKRFSRLFGYHDSSQLLFDESTKLWELRNMTTGYTCPGKHKVLYSTTCRTRYGLTGLWSGPRA